MAKTDTDLQELKDLINSRFDNLEERMKALETGQNKIDTRLTVIETRLEEWKPTVQKIPDLAEKVGELKNWRQIALVVITGTFGSIFGWFLRGGRM